MAGTRRETTYDVRVWSVRRFVGKKGSTYRVRWAVARQETGRSFPTRALADRFRSDLVAATSRGEMFDVGAGLPLSMMPDDRRVTWWEWSQKFVDLKWSTMAPKSRLSVAEALTTATMALLSTDRGRPPEALLRSAMRSWAFVKPRRLGGPPPARLAKALDWLSRNSVRVADLEDPALARAVLEALTLKLDGCPAAATTVARKRAVLFNALELAVEQGLLVTNPLTRVRWRPPRTNDELDPACVVSHRQAKALLVAVERVGANDATARDGADRSGEVPDRTAPEPQGAPLVALFGCMYYAATRPSEALALRETDLRLPPTDQEFGQLRLARGNPTVAALWTDNGKREPRQLKHRAVGAVRMVPCPPELVTLLRAHLRTYGAAQDGRLFRGPLGGSVREEDYQGVWQVARRRVLTDAETSPLARRPYDLRHACLSTWLAGGVDSALVAAWAGHSMAVLHRVYAHVLNGREDVALRRIEKILRTAEDADDE